MHWIPATGKQVGINLYRDPISEVTIHIVSAR